jgi:excisionase family DNA binding protein
MHALLTQHDAAQALRLSTRTLERPRQTGGSPKFVKVGRSIRYRRQDIEAFVTSRPRPRPRS